MSQLLTISETARRSGVASSALRYYEERGLISAKREGSGHRRYPRPVLRRIAFVVFAQKVGLSLEEIAAELDKLPPQGAPGRKDWSRLSATWRGRIDERIAELERLKEGLTECIGCGCLSLDRCKLANPDDRAARFGSGPRYWLGDPPLPGAPLPEKVDNAKSYVVAGSQPGSPGSCKRPGRSPTTSTPSSRRHR